MLSDLENKILRTTIKPMDIFEVDAGRFLRVVRFSITKNMILDQNLEYFVRENGSSMIEGFPRCGGEFSKIFEHESRLELVKNIINMKLLPFATNFNGVDIIHLLQTLFQKCDKIIAKLKFETLKEYEIRTLLFIVFLEKIERHPEKKIDKNKFLAKSVILIPSNATRNTIRILVESQISIGLEEFIRAYKICFGKEAFQVDFDVRTKTSTSFNDYEAQEAVSILQRHIEKEKNLYYKDQDWMRIIYNNISAMSKVRGFIGSLIFKMSRDWSNSGSKFFSLIDDAFNSGYFRIVFEIKNRNHLSYKNWVLMMTSYLTGRKIYRGKTARTILEIIGFEDFSRLILSVIMWDVSEDIHQQFLESFPSQRLIKQKSFSEAFNTNLFKNDAILLRSYTEEGTLDLNLWRLLLFWKIVHKKHGNEEFNKFILMYL